MRRRARQVQARQAMLQMRNAALRDRLVLQSQTLAQGALWTDRALAAWQWLRAHPEWPVGVGAGLLVLRPRRLVRWGGRAWWAWQLWRRLRPLARVAVFLWAPDRPTRRPPAARPLGGRAA